MKEYDDETLSKVQRVELEIFKDFIAICEKNDLTYFALGGTGIGALRHKGFVPWDDDIDVGLPREDYEKLIKCVTKEYPDKYIMMNAETDENYPLMTTRMMLRGTTFREESLKDIKCTLGIFLDIYAFDNASDDEKQLSRQAYTAWFWSKMLILRSIAHPVLGFSGFKANMLQVATAITHYAMAILHISKKWLYNNAKKASCRYNDKKTDRMGYFCDTDAFANFVACKQLKPLQSLEFEGIKVNFQQNLDESLRMVYGDYMKLPPAEKRKNHFPFELDFGAHDGKN